MTETITRILVPVDFSPDADGALEYAAGLAARLGASIEILHVIDDSFLTGAWSAELQVPHATEFLKRLRDEAELRLGRLRESIASRGITATVAVQQGPPARTIAAHAADGGFDLIAMGTHGRTGLSHVLLGSVAERVVRLAPCPVLTRKGTIAAAPRPDEVTATTA